MLKLVFSRIRGGKTTYVTNLIKDYLRTDKKITLIVPEQYSFTTEKNLLEAVGPAGVGKIDICSFTSLAESLMPSRDAGKLLLDESAGAALMSLALEDTQDKLGVYRRHASSPSLVSEFISIRDELVSNGISSETLREKMPGCAGTVLERKISDICLVMDAYDSLLAESGFSDKNAVASLAQADEEYSYFDGRVVFIDAFRGFTGAELGIIEKILASADQVYVTLCCVDMNNPGDGADIFYHTKRTAAAICRLARKHSVPVNVPDYLSKGNKYNNFPPDIVRYKSPAIEYLEKSLFSPDACIYDAEDDTISLYRAPDIYSECTFVACMAKRLIREQGYRCRDIAIISRNIGSYEAPLRSALNKCGINVFEDKRHSIVSSPLIRFVLTALDVCADGFLLRHMSAYLKTGLLGYSVKEISEFENYITMWQLSGKAWEEDFTLNPAGFGEKFTPFEEKKLAFFNEMRKSIVTPLVHLSYSLNGARGEKVSKAVYSFIRETDVRKHLSSLACSLNDSGNVSAAIEQDRVWESLMGLLDSFSVSVGSRCLPKSRIRDIFTLMASARTMGTIPQGVDEITIANADRVRTGSPRAVFVIGAVEGAFPALPSSGSVLNDKDRRQLLAMDIELNGFGEEKIAEERFIAYTSLFCASERLCITCPEKNSSGMEVQPSGIIDRITELFPDKKLIDIASLTGEDSLIFAEGADHAFELMAQESRSGSVLYSSLREYFSSNQDYSGRLEAFDTALRGREFALNDKDVAEKLFGRQMYLSASKAESYNKCHFRYFCQYGLRAKAEKKADMDSLNRGTVIHYVLEKIMMQYKDDEFLLLTQEEKYNAVMSLLNGYMDEFFPEKKDDRKFLVRYSSLANSLVRVLNAMVEEFTVTAFRPVDTELEVGGTGEGLPAYEIRGEDGVNVTITGKIDRVDIADSSDKRYLRIIDYKSDSTFSLGRAVRGLDMQMLIYLFSIWSDKNGRYGEIVPSGVFYAPYKLEKGEKKKMSGLALDDEASLWCLDTSGKGTFIKNISGSRASGKISMERMVKLKKRVDSLLLSMAYSLLDGDISAYPAADACKFCDYRSICRYEEGIPVDNSPNMGHDQALKVLDEEVSDDEQ